MECEGFEMSAIDWWQVEYEVCSVVPYPTLSLCSADLQEAGSSLIPDQPEKEEFMLARFPWSLAGVTAFGGGIEPGDTASSSSSSSSGTDSFLLRGLIRRPNRSRAAQAAFSALCRDAKVASLADSLFVLWCLERLDVESVLAWPLDVEVGVCLGVADFSDSSFAIDPFRDPDSWSKVSDFRRAASSASALAFVIFSNSSWRFCCLALARRF
jgi:hypothetical protein